MTIPISALRAHLRLDKALILNKNRMRRSDSGRYDSVGLILSAPAHRRSGIGRRLVDAGEARLRAAGVKRASALVEGHRPIAQAFWSAAGFEQHEGMRRYTKSV